MTKSELKPSFEEEFPDNEHPDRNEVNIDYEIGRINAAQAGYTNSSNGAQPKTKLDQSSTNSTAYPEGSIYTPHPIPPGQRQRTIGDEPVPKHIPSKADHIYGPKTNRSS